MLRLIYSALVIGCVGISSCAHKPQRQPTAIPELNLRVYRIEIGRKSSAQPIAELFMPANEFQAFLATREFRDREFRGNTFYSGCYLFEHSGHRASRTIASQKEKAEPIFCYDSALDRFQAKSPLLP